MTEGRVIHGRYRLSSKLGQGGMGTVWRAVHLELGTPVAVKLIDPAVADSKVALSRFKREAQSAASLRGTNVVQILDYGIDDSIPYIVMELLEGESLAMRLARLAPLSPQETARILGQVGKALARAHAANIVHRDLKPDNVFIVRDGDEDVTKVLDFGIAKTMSTHVFEASIQTKSGAILGTPHYMSPEQASGRTAVDNRCDIWSLGVIAFECLTGVRPFNGSTLGSLVLAICAEPIPIPSQVSSVPQGFDQWFARCVTRNADGRFQSITDAVTALRHICDPTTLSGAPLPMESNTGRERTLQTFSRAPSLRTPSARTPHDLEKQAALGRAATVLASEGGATVTAASRTVGATAKRRPLLLYVTMVLVVGAGVVMSALGLQKRWGLAGAASTNADLASTTVTGLPTGFPTTPTSAAAPPSAAPEPSTTLPLTIEAKPPAVAPSPIMVSRTPRTASSTKSEGITSVAVVASAASAQAASSIHATVAAPPADPTPTSGPEPAPADTGTSARRRNVEDRLAF